MEITFNDSLIIPKMMKNKHICFNFTIFIYSYILAWHILQ